MLQKVLVIYGNIQNVKLSCQIGERLRRMRTVRRAGVTGETRRTDACVCC